MIRILFAKIPFLFLIFAYGKLALAGATPDMEWTYKKVDGKPLKLFVFLPDDYQSSEATREYPVIVIFHGGSWRSGDASWHFPDCEYWSSRGMIAASVDYRLKDRDNVDVPLACVQDAKSAIRFLRKNADVLKLDPNRIVAAGGSAGGQLAASLATIKGKRSNDPADDASVSCEPDAVILYNPWFKCAPELSPPRHIAEELPPFVTFLGDEDPGIPVEEIVAFHESLEVKNNRSALFVGKGGKHGFCNGRNPNNRFFYWSLGLADHFLIELGILSGIPTVNRPDGVLPLQTTEYQSYSNSLRFVSLNWSAVQNQESVELPIDDNMKKLLDPNNDNKVSLEESLAFQSTIFDNSDLNKDLFLTQDEFKVPQFYATGDKDSDGKLSRKEYLAIHENFFKVLDTNKDGVLTGKDTKWVKMMNGGNDPRESNSAQTGNLNGGLPLAPELVARIDSNKNGKISKQEFVAQSTRRFDGYDKNKDVFLDSKEFQRTGPFLLADKNADGKLSKDEFLLICEGVFLGLDKNGDGELSTADGSSENAPKKSKGKSPLPDHLMKAMDVDRDNQVTREEFLNFRRNQFPVFDKNSDKSLTADEYTHAPSFKHADKDKNGKLTESEYMSIFRPHFPAMDKDGDGIINSADAQ